MAKESDDDFCPPQPTVSLLAAPRRPEKKGEIQSVPVISVSSKPAFSESCELNVDTSLLNEKSDLGDQCAICSKSISHLNNIRKTAHVNKCLDAQESSDMHIKAKEKWNSMVDCPMCGQPLPLGPHRSAHAKRCGKIHNIAPKELLKLMETQRRVCDAKKLRNIPHTKAPVPVKKKVVPVELKDAPNSLFAENLQYAKALSASEFPEPTVEVCENSPQFKRIFDPNEKKRKRPRSYAVVELAPRACKCEVLEKIHDRFLEAFRVRKINGTTLSHSEACEHFAIRTKAFMENEMRLLEKVERLERLSKDIYNLIEDNSLADLRIECHDGSVDAHSCLVHARTSLKCKSSEVPCKSVQISECRKIVMYWLQYVYSSRIEWEKEDTEKIRKLADQFGPDDLPAVCAKLLSQSQSGASSRPSDPTRNSSSTHDHQPSSEGVEVTNSINKCDVSYCSVNHQCAPNVIPSVLKVELISTQEKSEFTVDHEDPLQGISLAGTINDQEIGNNSVIIDETTGCSRSTAEEICEAKSLPKNLTDDAIIHSTSPNGKFQERTDEITIIDLSIESHLGASTSCQSPDIFEEKNGAPVATSVLTPLSCSSNDQKCSSTFQISTATRLSSTLLHQRVNSWSGKDIQEHNEIFEVPINETMTSEEQNILDSTKNDACFNNTSEKILKFASTDSYENEYFEYHDPYMETWYEPVEMPALNQIAHDVEESHHSTDDQHENYAERPSSVHSGIECSKKVNADCDFESCSSSKECYDTLSFIPPTDHSTPVQPSRKKARFGSNVKILKTTDITPVPSYETMTEECLKQELKKFGLKPMGKRRAVAVLKRIYAELHPEIDPLTPTIRPLAIAGDNDNVGSTLKSKSKKFRARGQAIRTAVAITNACDVRKAPSNDFEKGNLEENEEEDFIDLGDKTLNDPTDEPPEESMIGDVGLLPKDLESMTCAFLDWLRSPENDELHNHLLSLQPVLIDELHLRMSRADSAVCCISKKALANILDNLGVTFSLSQISGGRRMVARKKGVRRKLMSQ